MKRRWKIFERSGNNFYQTANAVEVNGNGDLIFRGGGDIVSAWGAGTWESVHEVSLEEDE